MGVEICESLFAGRIPADRIDRTSGIVRGVKLVGLEAPDKRRRYSAAGLRESIKLYEGCKAYVDHQDLALTTGKRPGRSYRDSFGFYRNIEFRENQGVFGDLHFNPKHSLAEQFCWDAEHLTNGVGLSHVATAKKVGKDRDGWELIESLQSVLSVDVVADPATTKNLFESESEPGTEPGKTKGRTMEFADITIESLGKNRPDLVEQIKRAAADEATKPLAEQITSLAAYKEGVEARDRLVARTASCRKLCEDAKLPASLITDVFVTTLVEAKDENHAKLIEDRVSLAKHVVAGNGSSSQKPQSTEQRLAEQRSGAAGAGANTGTPATAKDFARQIR